jgi:hypothetical protein
MNLRRLFLYLFIASIGLSAVIGIGVFCSAISVS